jgi:SWI/SNF-related matrix-associated actin-dependent regulator of chromatin subfamily D
MSKAIKFSSFFKKLFIQLDKDEYPSDWHIEWNKHDTVGDFDGFEMKRTGPSTTAHIFLFLQSDQGKYRVNPALLSELGLPVAPYTKTTLILTLWNYVRNRKLQEPTTPTKVMCNQALKTILGVNTFTYHDIPKLLTEHIGPPDPIQISYTIRTQGEVVEQWYEFPVDVPVPHPPFNVDPATKPEIEAIDDKIHSLLQQINSHKEDIRSYLEFANDPVTAIEEHIAKNVT